MMEASKGGEQFTKASPSTAANQPDSGPSDPTFDRPESACRPQVSSHVDDTTTDDWTLGAQAWTATGDIFCSGAVAGSDDCLPQPPTESDRFVCGDDFLEQVNYQPYRVLSTRELTEPPFASFFENIDCLNQISPNFLITPSGFYRAILEVIEHGDQSDEAILTALLSRFGLVPEIIKDEDIIYAEDLEPCMIDENGNPLDHEYWTELHGMREFWGTIPGGREYTTVKFDHNGDGM